MKSWVSLWSADPLRLADTIELLDGHVDGFHLDVMDGSLGCELLHGPALVAAICGRVTKSPVEVHIVVADADRWLEPYAQTGVDYITVQRRSCADVRASLERIETYGVRPGLALEVHEPVSAASGYLESVERLLLMGTELGVKGAALHPTTCERVLELAGLRQETERRPEIIVDGGIRRTSVGQLAQAGADGVVPGSLVFSNSDWWEALSWVHGQVPPARVDAR
jgi:ribulose-phosphate 3-epimerase